MKQYNVKRCDNNVDISAAWDSAAWDKVPVVKIDNFHERSSDHRPVVECKLQHDGTGFYGLFQVADRYVRSVNTELNSSVCRDSCVEFFVEPPGNQGYFNFEFNCGGTLLLFHIKDCTRGENGFKEYAAMTEQDIAGMKIFHTMPAVVEPELPGPVTWRLGFYIPYKLFENKTGVAASTSNVWRANFYKCGDKTSHPHWGMWSPLEILNFHQPNGFGEIVLE